MIDLLIRGCDILTLEGGQGEPVRPQVLTGQEIAIQGERIVAVRASPAGGVLPAEPRPGEAKELLQAGGPGAPLLAIPGLINTHAHVPMVLFRGLVEDVSIQAWFNDYIWPLESNLTEQDVYWGALLGLAEMIEGGVTQVADHYFYMDQVAQAVELSGMRANLAWAVFGSAGTPTSEDQARLEATCEFIQRWQGRADGRITAWLGPHAPYTSGPEFLRLCARRAGELGVGIHTHVSETAEQVQLSLEQSGMTPVRMLAETGILEVPTILAHCLYPSAEDIEILARLGDKARAGIAHAPKTYLKLGMGTAPLDRWREAGVAVGLATDGAVSSNTLDILEQLRLSALAQKNASGDSTSYPVGQALELAFRGGVAVMQQAGELGEITPGRLADITLIRQDGLHLFPRFDPAASLVYSARASDVHTVICNGKTLLRDGKLLTIDKQQVKREVAARLERLSQRTPGKRIAVYPA